MSGRIKYQTVPCILFAGPEYFIEVGGHEYRFELHEYCGPIILNKNGDPAKGQPGERSPFWKAFEAWSKQGYRVNGKCAVWEPIPEPRVEHIVGRHYRMVKPVEQPGDTK